MAADLSVRRPALKISIPIISISWHGGTRVLVQIANHLGALGHQATFLVARARCRTPFAFGKGVLVRELGVHTGLKSLDYFIFLCCVPFAVGANTILIANFFATYYPVRFVSILKKLPYLYFVQDIESKFPLPRGIVLNFLCRLTYRDRRIVAANSYLQRRLESEFGTVSRRIEVGPDRAFYEKPRSSVGKKYDVIYFLRKETWKGLDRFLKFLACSNGLLTCLCVSQDETLARVLVDSTAEFRKPEDDDDLIECIDACRVLLLTSYHEGFALPPLEGMARGLPTVLFRCGGPDQYILDGTNAVYVEDELQAVSTVRAMVDRPVDYLRMSVAAVHTAEKYRMDDSLSKLTEFVEKCAGW